MSAKNPLLARVLGESDDVVPVIANLPRANYRDRLSRLRARRGEDADGKTLSDGDSVRRMVGEADAKRDERIIPDDAEDVDTSEMTVGKPLRPVKDVVLEPSHPSAEKEMYMTPYSALTAPDVTPRSTQPVDPSRVPGAGAPEKFTVADLERGTPVGAPEAERRTDGVINPMDLLLNRQRPAAPAGDRQEFEDAGTVTTEEQAAALLGIRTPLQESARATAANVMVSSIDGGTPMPPPAAPTDGKNIYSAFRRFAG